MGWLRVDDEFSDSPKVDCISDVAARIWVMCGNWCSKKKNRHLDGFVPAAALPTITKRRWSDDVLEQAIVDLVETSKLGGLHKHGLWEPREGGWRFHDWEKYQPDDGDEEPLTAKEAASIAGKASAAARKEKNGTAQPQKPRTDSERPSKEAASIAGKASAAARKEKNGTAQPQKPRTDSERPSNGFNAFENRSTERDLERLEPPGPGPGSDSSNLKTQSKEPVRLEPEQPKPAAPREKPRHIRNFERSLRAPMPAAELLFEAYRGATGKTGMRYDHKARELFERLVDEGETPQSVSQAARGATLDPWARDTAKLAAEPVLSSSSQREKFRAIARDPPKPRLSKGQSPPQPNSGYQPKML